LSVTFTPTDTARYEIVVANAKINVLKAQLTITVINKTREYGQPNPVLGVRYTGFVLGETSAVLTKQPALSTLATESSAVGLYPITVGGAEAENYSVDYVNGTIQITKAPLKIIAQDQGRPYGAANPTFTVRYEGFVLGQNESALTVKPKATSAANIASQVGNYVIDVSGASARNYNITYQSGTLSVTKAPLTVIPEDKVRTYGAANPKFTARYEGFVLGDNESVLTKQPVFSTTATVSSPVGVYTIVASSAAAANYELSYASGALTVAKAKLTITVLNKTREYGSPNPVLGVRYTGFVLGETSAVLTKQPALSTMATASSPVGLYAIMVGGAEAGNYAIDYVNGTLQVNKAPLRIIAEDQSRPYGAQNPALTVRYEGFVLGQTETALTVKPRAATVANISSPVGAYAIDVSGASARNYSITYQSGTLSVTKAVLTVIPEDKVRTYGAADPKFTARYEGFVLGDNESVLTKQPVFATTATVSSPVGIYAIIASGTEAANYEFNYASGSLTVAKAKLTIIVLNKTRAYGSPNPVLGVRYSGFVLGENAAVLTKQPMLTTIATTTTAVGTYPVMAGGAEADNYSISYVNGTMQITKASLKIIANDQNRPYGSPDPILTVRYEGFVLGQNEAALTVKPKASTKANINSPVGAYEITVSGASARNYNITYQSGTLAVTKAQLNIVAEDKVRTYGAADPKFTVRYEGFVLGDNESVLTKKPVLATTAAITSPVGRYVVLASGAEAANYEINYTSGALTVEKARLNVIVLNKTRTYGSPNPVLNVRYTGFVLGETSAVLTKQPSLTTIATTTTAVGIYPVMVGGAEANNYSMAYVNGTIQITRAPLKIYAENKSRPYGSPNPTLTVRYEGFVLGQTESALTVKPVLTTTANINSPVGTYPITVKGASARNYSITYFDGILTVTPP
jgi:hypothetical protein